MGKLVQVLRVTQSPMNPKRWCFDLACGHEKWVTASCRPKLFSSRYKPALRDKVQTPRLEECERCLYHPAGL